MTRLILGMMILCSFALADKYAKGYKITCFGNVDTHKVLKCDEEFFVGSTDDEKFAFKSPLKLIPRTDKKTLKAMDAFVDRRIKYHKKKEKISSK